MKQAEIHFHQTTTLTPEQYVAGLTDFGPGRSKLFGNSAEEAHPATRTTSRVTQTAQPTLTSSSYARARISKADCSASCSKLLAGAFWKRHSKTLSKPSKPATARLEWRERQARHEPGARTVEFSLQCQQI